MKVTMTVDLDPNQIVSLTDQLSSRDFGKVRMLMESRARQRFGAAMLRAKKEFRRSGLTRRDAEMSVRAARANAK